MGTAQAQQTAPAKAPKTAPARTYTEVIFDAKTSDPKAVAIVQKLLKDDIADMESDDSLRKPVIFANFQSLGPNLPADAIFTYIQHTSVCGSSGCRVVVFSPSENNKYDIVLDTTLGRIFKNLRQGKAHYDLLSIVVPRASDGFGVFFWNEIKHAYAFAGVSKFSRK